MSYFSQLPSNFEPTKIGYKKYLKAMLVTDYDGINTPLFCLNFAEFQNQATNKVADLENRLQISVDYWQQLLLNGADDTDESSEAYFCKTNCRKMVEELDKLL